MEFELIGIFKGKDKTDNGKEFQELSYLFDVMLLEDYKNGKIKGIGTFFNGFGGDNFKFPIFAYSIGNLEELTEEEIEEEKHYYLDDDEQRFLESLKEGDVITFKANIQINCYHDDNYGYNEHLDYRERHAYNFKRLDEELAREKINLYLTRDLKYYL